MGIANWEDTWGARGVLSFDQSCGYVDIALVFCDVKTNYHKLSGVKTTYGYFLSVSMDQKSGHSLVGSLALSCNQDVGWAVFWSRSLSGDELAPKLVQVAGRIYFLAVVWSTFLWLLTEEQQPPTAQVLEAAHRSLPHGPLQWSHLLHQASNEYFPPVR